MLYDVFLSLLLMFCPTVVDSRYIFTHTHTSDLLIWAGLSGEQIPQASGTLARRPQGSRCSECFPPRPGDITERDGNVRHSAGTSTTDPPETEFLRVFHCILCLGGSRSREKHLQTFCFNITTCAFYITVYFVFLSNSLPCIPALWFIKCFRVCAHVSVPPPLLQSCHPAWAQPAPGRTSWASSRPPPGCCDRTPLWAPGTGIRWAWCEPAETSEWAS